MRFDEIKNIENSTIRSETWSYWSALRRAMFIYVRAAAALPQRREKTTGTFRISRNQSTFVASVPYEVLWQAHTEDESGKCQACHSETLFTLDVDEKGI